MTAQADLDILRMFVDEAQGHHFLVSARGDDEAPATRILLWMVAVLLEGGRIKVDGDGLMSSPAAQFLDNLPCRPLLQPWLEPREWSPEQVIALKVAHKLEPKR